MGDDRETAAQRYDEAAAQMDLAAHHLRVAAERMREGEVPSACAHALAGHGHLLNGRRLLDANASLHATKAR